MKRIQTPFALLLPLVLTAGAGAGAPGAAASVKDSDLAGSDVPGSIEARVGCWALEHREDWAPNVHQTGYLSGAQGARTYRAEWIAV